MFWMCMGEQKISNLKTAVNSNMFFHFDTIIPFNSTKFDQNLATFVETMFSKFHWTEFSSNFENYFSLQKICTALLEFHVYLGEVPH